MPVATPHSPGSESTSPREAGDLSGHEIVVAVCGGISAYKTAAMVSALVQRGAGVTVAMTSAGQRFVTPLTFETLTARRVFTSLWDAGDYYDPQHLNLTQSANLFIVAPATANTIGKVAHGIADDLVSTMLMSAACPVLLAPAMNTGMWENPIVQQNLQTLVGRGLHVAAPGEGWLACRRVGAGRMAEPAEIIKAAVTILTKAPPA